MTAPRHALVPGLVLLALAAAAPARADAGPKLGRGLYLPAGLSLGAALRPDLPNGFTLGAEVSAVWLETDRFVWLGLYADAVYDFGLEAARFSVGPELGWSVFGLDGGLLVQRAGDVTHTGFTVRPLVTLGFVAAYLRWGHLPSAPAPNFAELGLLMKWPLAQPDPPRRVQPSDPDAP